MNLSLFLSELKENTIEFNENESMKQHTTFKIGGNADVFVIPKNKEQLLIALKSAKQNGVPCFILGKGSNLLVSDGGIEGAVISLNCLDGVKVKDKTVICGAGANLSAVCISALKNNLSGLEFAFGIPGSVGGALFMNAGAYGGEMKDIIKGAYCIDADGNQIYIEKSDMNLSYRSSAFKENGYVITEVLLELESGNYDDINAKMQELLNKRKLKQPLEMPSAGSTFKRPKDNFAGTLIEKNGLKGEKVGGAMVSEKHAGFVVNCDNASADDVLKLIEKVKERVYSGDKIMLEPEVIFVGRK